MWAPHAPSKEGAKPWPASLPSAHKYEAVFCSSDLLALGVMTEARARQLSVPNDDMAVMGFGDVPFVADMVPAAHHGAHQRRTTLAPKPRAF